MRITNRTLLAAILALVVLRLVAAAILPLSADEAYYWLWSRHPGLGYYDHPPLIAWVIRAGTFVFGDTAFGVRIVCVLLSALASWFTYAAARILLDNERGGLIAALLFNLTLMVAVESMAATPDAPVLAAAAAFVFALARLVETKDGRWWLVAGLAAGIGLLAKYTMPFLGAGALVWLCLSPPYRHWLRSPWPYAGAMIAAVIFAPNIWWNAQNEWLTFAFQFGRAAAHRFNPGFIAEFIAAQFVLATPLILLAALLGLERNSRVRGDMLFMLPALCLPALVYFLWHGLHDRVQGNWPSFLYPLLAIAAVAVFNQDWSGWRGKLATLCRRAAIPLALVLLAVIYAQAFFTLIPLGRGDPVARLLAFNISDVTDGVRKLRAQGKANAILTSDYATTAWLSFYMRDVPVVPVGEPKRWRFAPPASPQLFREPVLYVTETRRDAKTLVRSHFGTVVPVGELTRTRKGVAIAHYTVYRATAPQQDLFLPLP